jgi:hypothetical protein
MGMTPNLYYGARYSAAKPNNAAPVMDNVFILGSSDHQVNCNCLIAVAFARQYLSKAGPAITETVLRNVLRHELRAYVAAVSRRSNSRAKKA